MAPAGGWQLCVSVMCTIATVFVRRRPAALSNPYHKADVLQLAFVLAVLCSSVFLFILFVMAFVLEALSIASFFTPSMAPGTILMGFVISALCCFNTATWRQVISYAENNAV